MVYKIWKARLKWSQLSLVLIREGEYAQTSGRIYVAVVQAVMLYGSETWVMTPLIERGFWRIPPQGGQKADGDTTSYSTVWWMGVSSTGGSNGGGVIKGGWDVGLPPPDHSCTFHCDQTHHGPLSGGGAEAGVKGDKVVVVSGCIGLGGDVDGVSGVVTDRRGRFDRRDRGGRGDELNQWGGYCSKFNLRHGT